MWLRHVILVVRILFAIFFEHATFTVLLFPTSHKSIKNIQVYVSIISNVLCHIWV